MERVETLLNLMGEKLRNNASADELLTTVRMLESELLHFKKNAVAAPEKSTAVNVSKFFDGAPVAQVVRETTPPKEEKVFEVLQVDEAEIAAELEEIKKNAEDRNKISVQNKPALLFDDIDDIPTLSKIVSPAAKPKEIHELIPVNKAASVNDTLKKNGGELSDSLQETPVKDLKKAIGVNDRYRYMSELFRGDEAMYERSLKTINSFGIFAEAEYWIRRELKLKMGWDDKNETVKQFDQLVRRRFS